MSDVQEQLDVRTRELRELVRSRSKASCSDVISTEIDVRRETRIEELEEEIRELRKQLKPR
jgi:HAMP domain-containing protein